MFIVVLTYKKSLPEVEKTAFFKERQSVISS